jgi:GT2 family glycosyltransferase
VLKLGMLIVVATPKTEEEYWNSVPGKCLSRLGQISDIFIRVIPSNTKGLPENYNYILGITKRDICVFIHDDVEIHDLFFYEKLKKAHEFYDIVGVAGATKQVYTMDKPSLWHLCCDNFIWGSGGKPGDGRGFITTPHNGHMGLNFFGPTPSEVDFIDGCFISVNIKKLKEADSKFDEDFKFHHYDHSFCLDAKKKGLRIGVYPIYLIHHSPGLKSFDKNFLDSDKKFKEKYIK